jgi:hypothetical protein
MLIGEMSAETAQLPQPREPSGKSLRVQFVEPLNGTIRRLQLFERMRGRHSNDAHPTSARRFDADVRILKDHAALGGAPGSLRREQEDLGIRFAVRDIFRSDDAGEELPQSDQPE